MEGALLIPFPKPDLSITKKTKQENLHEIPLLSNKRLGLPCKILFRQPTQYLTALGDHSTPTIFQRYTYRVLQTIQMKLILLCV